MQRKTTVCRVACYIRTGDRHRVDRYDWDLVGYRLLPLRSAPVPPKRSRMQELARAYLGAVRANGGVAPDRRKFFRRQMGRIPSRAYMSRIVKLSRAAPRRRGGTR